MRCSPPSTCTSAQPSANQRVRAPGELYILRRRATGTLPGGRVAARGRPTHQEHRETPDSVAEAPPYRGAHGAARCGGSTPDLPGRGLPFPAPARTSWTAGLPSRRVLVPVCSLGRRQCPNAHTRRHAPQANGDFLLAVSYVGRPSPRGRSWTIRRSQLTSRASAPLPGGSAPIASAYHRTATCHWLEGMVKGGVMKICKKHRPPDRHV